MAGYLPAIATTATTEVRAAQDTTRGVDGIGPNCSTLALNNFAITAPDVHPGMITSMDTGPQRMPTASAARASIGCNAAPLMARGRMDTTIDHDWNAHV